MKRSLFRALLLAVGAWALTSMAEDGANRRCPPAPQEPTASQLQLAARQARDHGALWRITRDENSSYLFATIHVGKLEWIMPGPQLRGALEATDTIALEIDLSDPQMVARMSAAGRRAAAPTLPGPLAARLARRLDAACVPEQSRPAIDAMHPLLQALTLAVLEARWVGLEAGYAQELVLAGFGHAAKRRIVSLESPESQLAALMPRNAEELHKTIAGALDQIDQGGARRSIVHLADAWSRGDLAELEQYERWCECVLGDADRQLLVRLLDERNPLLAERIDALHREGRKVLAGVGAMHMTGAKGLPALLRARGFVVERLAFH